MLAPLIRSMTFAFDENTLAKDVARILTFVKAYPGITGRQLILETGLELEKVVKVSRLMEDNEVITIQRTFPGKFETSRLYPKV